MKIIEIAAHTDTGRQRTDNQDAFICEPLWGNELALLGVIDGVGGYAGGDKAAAIARTSIRNYMKTPKGDTLTMLREAVVFANNQIEEERKKGNGFAEMCCVITVVVTDAKKGKYCYVHVGDTRLYRYNNDGLTKITRDHSLVGVREDAGELSETEAMNHPQRNIILRELGSAHHRIDDEDFLDYGENDFLPGDLLLLCSDGLSDMISASQITEAIQPGEALDKRIRKLISRANEMGGKDNITVVLAKNNAITAPTPVLKKSPAAVHIAVATPVTDMAKPIKTAGTQKNSMSFLLVLLFMSTAAVIWFTKDRVTTGTANTAVTNTATISADTLKLQPADSLHIEPAPVLPGGAKPEPAIVPVRIKSAMSLAYMMNNHPDTAQILFELFKPPRHSDSTALEISKTDSAWFTNDTLTIKNKVFKDFKFGIKLKTPVFLKLENVVFENVKYPLFYDLKKDSTHKSILKL